MRKLLEEYRWELLVALLALVGFIIMIGDFGVVWAVRVMVWRIGNFFSGIIEQVKSGSAAMFSDLTVYDYTGFLILVFAMVFIGWRMRNRFLESNYWHLTACPRCGGTLHRTHRTALDRLLTRRILPYGRRFLCSNCGWSGLLHRIERAPESYLDEEMSLQ